jgi:hypothetical protein
MITIFILNIIVETTPPTLTPLSSIPLGVNSVK